MELLYKEKPYLQSTECNILSVDGNCVTTDRTVFYPEGGGQSGDRGYLGEYRVLDTKKAPDGNSILVLEDGAAVTVGQSLEQKLDWKFRYNGMVIHSAQHMLSGLLYTMFSIGTVAVHMGEDYLTIETDRQSIEQPVIDALVARANAEISACHPVRSFELSHEEAEALGLRRSIKVQGRVRIVEIEGVDRIACGGVHVSDTGEIRLVVYTASEQIRGHQRLFFRCGESAVEHAVSDSRTINALGALLSCGEAELEERTRAVLADLNTLKAGNASLKKSLAYYSLKEHLTDGVAAFEIESSEDISSYAHAVSSFEDLGVCILQEKDGKTLWLIALKGRYDTDFNILRQNLLPLINAKGGGKSPVFQGVAQVTDKESLDRFRKEFLKSVGQF